MKRKLCNVLLVLIMVGIVVSLASGVVVTAAREVTSWVLYTVPRVVSIPVFFIGILTYLWFTFEGSKCSTTR